MPRKHPRKDIVLLLPPIPNDRPGPSQAGPSTLSSAAPPPITLDGLLLARKLARKEGKAFDMESFMSPEMRAEWYARNHQHQPRSRSASSTNVKEESAKRPREEEQSTPVVPESADAPLEPMPPLEPSDGPLPSPTPIDSTASTPSGIPKRQKPNLLHMHWKRREKLLAQWEAENALVEAGIPIDPAHSVETILSGLPGIQASTAAGGSNSSWKRELTDKEKDGIMGSASYWNSLLISARKARGPQWDFNTQQHHVDRQSHAYYSHMDKPLTSELPKDEKVSASILRNGPDSHSAGMPPLPNGLHDTKPPPQADHRVLPNGLNAPRTAMPSHAAPPPSHSQTPQNQFQGYSNLAPAQMQALMAMQAQAQAQAQARNSISGATPSASGGSGSGNNSNASGQPMGGINPMYLAQQQQQQQQQQQRLSGSAPTPNNLAMGQSQNMPNVNYAAMVAAAQAQAAAGGGGGGGSAALQQAMQGLPSQQMPNLGMQGMQMQGMQGMQMQGQSINMAQLQGQFPGMNAGQVPQWMRNGGQGQGQGQGPMLTGGWGQK